MRPFQAITENVVQPVTMTKDKLAAERGDMANVDPETLFLSYWRVWSPMIYAKIERLQAQAERKETPSAPDANGNVFVTSSGSISDVEYSINFTREHFGHRHPEELEADCLRDFVTPLLKMVPKPHHVLTMMRMYAQDIVPTYDDFINNAAEWMEVWTEYDKAKDTGLLEPAELEVGLFTDHMQIVQAFQNAEARLNSGRGSKSAKNLN